MRNDSRIYYYIIILLVFSHRFLFSQSIWKQENFILGVFYDPPVDIKRNSWESDIAKFKLVKEANFNLLTGTQGKNGIDHSFEGMKWTLALASEVGVKYLVTDNRVYEAYNNIPNAKISETIINDYRSLPEKLRRAMLGYNICDEPNFTDEHKRNVKGWKYLLETKDRNALIYYNLVPSYAVDYKWGGFKSGNNNGILELREKLEYEEYLSFYIDSLSPSIICYDHYPFFKNGRVRRDYFYNLEIIKKKAGIKPFWAVPMAVDHLSYVNPSGSHLRFMFFCPLAYGAKGLIVFTFWTHEEHDYREAMIDKKGNKTEKFEIIKQINSFILRVLSDVVLNYNFYEVVHSSTMPQGQIFIPTIKDKPSHILEDFNENLLIGVFYKENDFRFIVVNKSLDKVINPRIKIRGSWKNVEISQSCIGFNNLTPIEFVPPIFINRNKSLEFKLPILEGGECRLIKAKNE